MRPLLLLVPLALAAQPPAPGGPVLTLRGEFGGGDLEGATLPVYAPDGKTVYAATSGLQPGRVLVIDPVEGAKTAVLAAPKPGADYYYPSGTAMSPDGRWLAVAFSLTERDDGGRSKEAGWDLQVWDLSTRTLATRKRGTRWNLGLLSFSPDGKHLAGATTGYAKEIDWYQATLFVWDVPGLAEKHTITRRGHGFTTVGFADEGGAAVVRVVDGEAIRVWDVATGKEHEPRPFAAGRTQLAAFSPDGSTLATATEVTDQSTGQRLAAQLSLFDATQGGKAWAVARGHKGEADRMRFSPDGRFLATTSFRALSAIVWDAENLAIQAELPTYGEPAFAPDGRAVTFSGTGYWSVPDGRHRFTLGRHPTQVWAVAFHPKGWQVASAENAPILRLWDPVTRRNTLNVPLDPNRLTFPALAFDRDGFGLAVADGPTVKLIKPDDGYVRATLKGHTSGVNAVAFSPDGKHLATAAGTVRWVRDEPVQDAGEVIVWHWERGGEAKAVRTLKGFPNGCFALAWSPDGKTLATGGGDPQARGVQPGAGPSKDAVKLWDALAGKELRAFPCDPRHHVKSLAWSSDGKHLAHTGIDGTRVRVLDPATGAERALLATPTEWLTFSPDGGLLAAVGAGGKGNAEGLIELWETAGWRKAASVVGHARPIHGAAFGPGGKALATGSDDGVLNLWDVRR